MTEAQQAAFRLACALPSRRHEWVPVQRPSGIRHPGNGRKVGQQHTAILYRGYTYPNVAALRNRLGCGSKRIAKLIALGEAVRVPR